MIYTLDALRREVLRQLDEEDDTETTKSLATGYLNQAHQLWCSDPRFKRFLISPEFTISVEVDKTTYPLPPLLDKLFYLRDTETNQALREIPARTLVEEGWPLQEALDAEYFSLWGSWPVKRHPEGRTIKIYSSNSSDTVQQIVVKGLTSDGEIKAELFTLAGTTYIVGTIVYQQILSVTKSADTAGTVTIIDSDENELLSLSPLEYGKIYPVLELIKTPSTTRTLKGRYLRKPLIMLNDYDVPEIPSPYSQGLVWEALLMFSGYNTDIGRTTQWERLRDEWKNSFDRYLWEGDTLNAEGTFIHAREEYF